MNLEDFIKNAKKFKKKLSIEYQDWKKEYVLTLMKNFYSFKLHSPYSLIVMV